MLAKINGLREITLIEYLGGELRWMCTKCHTRNKEVEARRVLTCEQCSETYLRGRTIEIMVNVTDDLYS